MNGFSDVHLTDSVDQAFQPGVDPDDLQVLGQETGQPWCCSPDTCPVGVVVLDHDLVVGADLGEDLSLKPRVDVPQVFQPSNQEVTSVVGLAVVEELGVIDAGLECVEGGVVVGLPEGVPHRLDEGVDVVLSGLDVLFRQRSGGLVGGGHDDSPIRWIRIVKNKFTYIILILL